jgi:hypothetical protein
MMAKAPDLVQIKIRMPRALLQRLSRDAARITGHSTNAEIVKRLQQSYETASLKDIAETVKATQHDLAALTQRFYEGSKRARALVAEKDWTGWTEQQDKPVATSTSGGDNDKTQSR